MQKIKKSKQTNNIKNAIHEITKIDELARRNQWINNIHPLVKLAVTILYIILTVSKSKYDISGLLKMAVYPITIFILGEINFKDSLKRLKIVLPLVCFVGILNPFFDKQVLFHFHGIQISKNIILFKNLAITYGMISMITLVLKGILTVFASYLLIATTTIEKICYALRLIKIPSVIVTQIMLTYRYVTLLLSEAHTTTQAYSLRAPNQKGIHIKNWGSLLGQLLLRSMDRAYDVYSSMTLRGFNGEYYYKNKLHLKTNDIIYLIFFIILLIFI